MSTKAITNQAELQGTKKSGAALKVIHSKEYHPDEESFAVDPANDPVPDFIRSFESDGATLSLDVACADGRRERLKLDNAESNRYLKGTLRERAKLLNRRICERRLSVAVKAVNRLTERNQRPGKDTLSPIEDAYLREFGFLDEGPPIPLEDGGYKPGLTLTESAKTTTVENYFTESEKLREDGDGFFDDDWQDPEGILIPPGGQREYLPRGGPQGQQLLLNDRWDMMAKAYWAWTHDPLVKDACNMIANFVLGRGISVVAKSKNVQKVIDEFNDREKIKKRLHPLVVGLVRDGNLFLRIMRMGQGKIAIRLQHPQTLWEIVTDGEDLFNVFWYVQRYQTRVQLYTNNNPRAAVKWIEHTILPRDMIHVKINASETDAFGRSDVFAGMAWGKRLRDYFDALVQKEQASAAFMWHIQVEGGRADVNRVIGNMPGTTPSPGSSWVTNKSVDVLSVSSDKNAPAGRGSAYEALINHNAIGFGLPKDYFGAGASTNRASGLLASEPSAKDLEHRQDDVRDFVTTMYREVILEAKRAGVLGQNELEDFRLIMPSIIKADSQVRMTMLRQGEAMAYWSKQTAAEQAAGEVDMDDYDFDAEIVKITAELGKDDKGEDIDPKRLISKDMEMVIKGPPQASQAAFDPTMVPNPDYTPGGNGHSNGAIPHDAGDDSPSSASGAAKIRNEVGAGGKADRRTMRQRATEIQAKIGEGAVVIIP